MTNKPSPSPQAMDNLNRILAKKWNKITSKHAEKKVSQPKSPA